MANSSLLPILVFLLSTFGTLSGCKQNTQPDMSLTKDLAIVDFENKSHHLLFFEVDTYHGIPRVCILLSTVNMKAIERKNKKGLFSTRKRDRIPDELTKKIFEARLEIQKKHMPDGIFNDAKNNPQVEDARWEDLAMHLEYGKSKAISFGKNKKANWVNLKELQSQSHSYRHAFDGEASQLEFFQEEIEKYKVGFFANLLVATISLAGWGSAAAIMAPVVGGVAVVGGVYIYFEKRTNSKLTKLKKLQGKIAHFLPKPSLLEENNLDRLEAETESIEGTDVYKALSQILTLFSNLWKSETDVLQEADAKKASEHLGVTEIFKNNPPGIFSDECPKSLLHTQTVASLLTK